MADTSALIELEYRIPPGSNSAEEVKKCLALFSGQHFMLERRPHLVDW